MHSAETDTGLPTSPPHLTGHRVPPFDTSELRQALEHAPDAIAVCRMPNLRIMFANAAAHDLLQMPAAGLTGKSALSFIHPDDRGPSAELSRRPPDGTSTFRVRRSDGTCVWVEATTTAMLRRGKGEALLVIARDVSHRRSAEEDLRRNQEIFHLFMHSPLDGLNVCEWDPVTTKRRLLFCNDRFVAMSGRSRAELFAATDLSAFVSPHLTPAQAAHNRRCIRHGVPYAGLASWKRPDGKENYYEWTAVSIKKGGKFHTVGIDRDVTERIRAEEALRRSDAMLTKAQRIARVGDAHEDLKTGRVTASDETLRIIGVDAEKLEGPSSALVEMVHPEDKARVLETIGDLKRTGKPVSFDYRLRRPDGRVVSLHSEAELERDDAGAPVAIVGTIQDVTDLRQAESSLRVQRNLGLSLNSAATLEEALALCVDAALRLSGMDIGGVYLMDEESGGFHLSTCSGLSPELARAVSFRAPDSYMAKLVHAGESVYVDISTFPGGTEFPVREAGYLQTALIPVHCEAVPVGCLVLSARSVTPPAEVVKHGLETVAAHIGTAVVRQRWSDALRQSQERIELALRAARMAAWDYHPADRRFVVQGRMGNPAESSPRRKSVALKEWESVIHPDDLSRFRSALQAHLEGRSDLYVAEYRVRGKEGGYRWVLDNGTAMGRNAEGVPLRVAGVRQDITQRKTAEQAVLRHQGQLRSLATKLELSEERERRRIAGGLHDEIGQMLALAAMKLGRVQKQTDSEKVHRSVREVEDLIESALNATRTLTFELSPPVLYELGFDPAMEWLADQMHDQHGLHVDLQTEGTVDTLDSELGVTLFRAVRELLLNVAKHAGTTCAEIKMRCTEDLVRIEVRDEGRGFDVQTALARGVPDAGFGLFSIRERIGHAGGRVDIRSRPGEGTLVALTAPLQLTDSEPGDAEP